VQRLEGGLAAVDGEALGGGEGLLRAGGELAFHGVVLGPLDEVGADQPRRAGGFDGSNDRRVESVPLNFARRAASPDSSGR
jgi:hypothetical protein